MIIDHYNCDNKCYFDMLQLLDVACAEYEWIMNFWIIMNNNGTKWDNKGIAIAHTCLGEVFYAHV